MNLIGSILKILGLKRVAFTLSWPLGSFYKETDAARKKANEENNGIVDSKPPAE